MNSTENGGALCLKDQHQAKLYFCKNCVRHKMPLFKVFYCQTCHPELRVIHQGHSPDRLQLFSKEFLTLYKKFKVDLRKWSVFEFDKKYKERKGAAVSFQESIKAFNSFIADCKKCYKKALIDENFEKKIRQEFQDMKYCQWLVDYKFWEPNSAAGTEIKQEIGKLIQEFLGEGQSQENPWMMKVVLAKKVSGGGASVDYDSEMTKLKDKVEDLNKQKQIGEMFIRLSSYFTNQQIEHGLQQIKTFQEGYNPVPFLFYLAKLKICQLHSEVSQKIKEILADQNFIIRTDREKELYHYFSAMSEWQQVQLAELEDEGTMLFFQARNKFYYKLENPGAYVSALTKAIGVEPRPLYYASRAIGYMAEGKYELAEDDFNIADLSRFKNDALLNNRQFNNLKRRNEIDRSVLKETISERSIEYISNMCKYLKKMKDYKNLKICCEELVSREPDNLSFRAKHFEAAFKLNDRGSAKEELSMIKEMDELGDDELIQFERKIELLKAREHEKLQQHEQAVNKYEHVAEMGDEVATHWYNYAAYLFNHRDEQQNNEKALIAINKALEIKKKPNYLKLKYMLLFVSDNMEEAKKMQGLLIDPNDELKLMKEYVNDT